MDSNDESNILLNLTTVSPPKSETAKIIKYRKKIDRQNGSQTQRKTKNLRKSEQSMGINSKTDLNKQKVLGNENHEKFEVISSLFRKNPELPDISSAVLCLPDHVKKKDETFSVSEFKQMNLDPFMISNLEKNLHLIKMTSVQKASMPSLLDGKDVFIKSPTGTGKTLSYVIPLVQSLQAIVPKIKRIDGPYCLILVPTRELACQTLKVVQEVLKPFIWIVPGSVTGGEKRKSEKARLRKGINILVATPGRLVDHLKTTKCLTLSQMKWLILDEADRLLDLGFEQDIGFILSTVKNHASRKVQNVLLSATLSRGVKNLLDVNMENPVTINMAGDSQFKHVEYQTPKLLEQFCVVVPMKLKLVTLAAFLQQKFQENCKVIVFFTTQDSVDFHFELYSSTLIAEKGKKLNLMKLHGKLSQNERAEVFTKFKESDQGILLCTDVASRGLDLPSVNWIVQYNPPVSPADYVHRVGRTARIGMSGQALLFLLPTEVSFLDILSERKLRVSELSMNEILISFAQTLRGRSTKYPISEDELRKLITEQHMKFEENVRQDKHLKQLASTAFRSFIGAYNTFPASVKHIFHPRNLHLGHLAKSFGLREAPSELKRKCSTEGSSLRNGRKVKYPRRFSESLSKSVKPEPMTKKLERK